MPPSALPTWFIQYTLAYATSCLTCWSAKPEVTGSGSIGGHPVSRIVDPTCLIWLVKGEVIIKCHFSSTFARVIPLIIITNECLGRRASMSLIAVLSALLFVILDVCMPKAVSIGILFVIRAFASGMFSIVYLYTNEKLRLRSYYRTIIS
ncbi:hypothetical protein ACTXT7_010496 [Hymenolepis weldensis]